MWVLMLSDLGGWLTPRLIDLGLPVGYRLGAVGRFRRSCCLLTGFRSVCSSPLVWVMEHHMLVVRRCTENMYL
ncbi:hypothetical protein ACLOJK_027216, partial [Asimina triloba]